MNDLTDEGFEFEILFLSSLYDGVDGQDVTRSKFLGQGKPQQMSGEGLGKASFLFDERFLEANNVLVFMFS